MVNITGYADTRYRLSVSGEPVDYFICDTNDEKLNTIKRILSDLRKKNFSLNLFLFPQTKIKVIIPQEKEKILSWVY